MTDLSHLRQAIFHAQQQRTELLHQILGSQPFIAAQVYERYKTCGNKNCKCHNGEMHGPFIWLYQHKKGYKVLSTTVDSKKVTPAKKLAASYKEWLQNRKQLRELEQTIQNYLDHMEQILEKEARDYATQRSPGRPRKHLQ